LGAIILESHQVLITEILQGESRIAWIQQSEVVGLSPTSYGRNNTAPSKLGAATFTST
jgi:hypothetical protein